MKKIILLMASVLFVYGAQAQQAATAAPKATAVKAVKKGKKSNSVKKHTAAAKEAAKFVPTSEEPSISLSSEFVEFGTIAKGSEPFRSIMVTNMGAKPLMISRCTGSCGCTVPTCPTEAIEPGASAEIKVRYDTERLGSINKTVTIFSNDPQNPTKSVQLKGMIE